MEKIFEIYIKTTPERLWEAITTSEIRSKYQFGNTIESDWTPGSRFEMATKAGEPLGEGENKEVDPPPEARPDHARALGRGRQSGGRLHHHLGNRTGGRFLPPHRHPQRPPRRRQRPALRWLADDLSGLKTWPETGEKLTTPGSLMYT